MPRFRVFSILALGLLLAGLAAASPALAAKSRCFGYVVTIKGDSGNNRLRGTSGVDVIDGKGGNDVIVGRGGEDVICGGNGDDVIKGGGGDDQLVGGGADDTILGGGGNDLMNGLLGNDHFVGGAGDNDTVSYLFSAGPVQGSIELGHATGGEGNDTFESVEGLFGSFYNDSLSGGPGFDNLAGFDGDDVLLGGDENDIIDGGAGNDIVDGQAGDRDMASHFVASGPVSADLTTDSSTGDGTDTLTSIESLAGGDYNDTLLGDDALNFLSGGPGNDTIDGRGDLDVAVYITSEGPVNVNLGTGTSTGDGTDTFQNLEAVYATNYSDTLTGDDGDNVFFGDFGDDNMSGGGGDDMFFPGPGNDTINGGDGTLDTVDYFLAPGPLAVNMAAGTVSGDGSDTFTAVELVSGSEFNDVFTGSENADKMMGEGGDDTINGLGGDDSIDAGLGTDSVDGGAGTDKCRDGETVLSCETAGGPTTHQFRSRSRSAGEFQYRRAH